MRTLTLFLLTLITAFPVQAAESCATIHGRAHFYGGAGQLRIWHVGTRYDKEPDESSWFRVQGWLEAGVKDSDIPIVIPTLGLLRGFEMKYCG